MSSAWTQKKLGEMKSEYPRFYDEDEPRIVFMAAPYDYEDRPLEHSNFRCIVRELVRKFYGHFDIVRVPLSPRSPSETLYLLLDATNEELMLWAEDLEYRLDDYAVYNEMDFSELETRGDIDLLHDMFPDFTEDQIDKLAEILWERGRIRDYRREELVSLANEMFPEEEEV